MEQNLPSASLSPEVPSSPNHLDVDSETSLPRVASSASFAPEACHIEDVDTGCQLHSHPSDLGLSRFNSNESTALVDSEAIHEAGEDVGNGQIQEEYQTDSEQANQDVSSSLEKSGQSAPLESPTKRIPLTINLAATKEHDSELSMPLISTTPMAVPTPMVMPPTPQLPLHPDAQSNGFNRASSQAPVSPSGSEISGVTFSDINWAFDNMKELLEHETGSLTRENIQAYAEQNNQGAISVQSTAPAVASDCHFSALGFEQGEKGNGEAHSPFGDEEAAGDDAALLDSIFAQAGAGSLGAQQDQPTTMFDTSQVANPELEESSFFDNIGNCGPNNQLEQEGSF